MKIRAESIAAALSTDPTIDNSSLASVGDDEDEFIQIVDGEDRVLASTENTAGEGPIGTANEVRVPFDSDRFIVAQPVSARPRVTAR